ncbi:FAD dependent oxidoreductase [Xenococcus sp. PCC 7305]|uniref:FAD-dependent oxidoreductase n=1 Tax=Xenococcus sp. PCC 7305 TaxID=102125 RepID=UPI0002ACB05E|nr:FAD-dependent oxidoreductase [Xenococcus sp. PCC 7305]ELS05105.1 FAD dependent oxidoreductase [Xenococcus sp. PCC 7305]
MNPALSKIAVLGAGIQGVCVALALQKQGYKVTLVDQATDCMLRTSLVNEGKIHLGHVYANDESCKTSKLMLKAALQFAPLIESWVDSPINWTDIVSNPFTYIIMQDSMLSPKKLFEHYERLEKDYLAFAQENRVNYLGTTLTKLWQKASVPMEFNLDFAAAAVATPELSVSLVKLRELMRLSINNSDNIETLYQHKIESVKRIATGFYVEGVTFDDEPWQHQFDLVVNCLWEGRLKIDQQLGIVPKRSWVYRLKYRILADLPEELYSLPSSTFVLGRYGDIVTFQSSKTAYLSWYPCCLQGWNTDITTPLSWENVYNGNINTANQNQIKIANDVLQAFDQIIPGLARSQAKHVAAGVIFSWGATDINDPESELHERHNIGVAAYDGYFSINTGKFTCAPLFAQQLLEKIK